MLSHLLLDFVHNKRSSAHFSPDLVVFGGESWVCMFYLLVVHWACAWGCLHSTTPEVVYWGLSTVQHRFWSPSLTCILSQDRYFRLESQVALVDRYLLLLVEYCPSWFLSWLHMWLQMWTHKQCMWLQNIAFQTRRNRQSIMISFNKWYFETCDAIILNIYSAVLPDL